MVFRFQCFSYGNVILKLLLKKLSQLDHISPYADVRRATAIIR